MRLWLRNKRIKDKISQEDLSNRVGISQNYYSSIETGNRRPSPKVAKKIAKELNLNWQDFFPDEED